MHDLNSIPPDLIRQLLELCSALVVPSSGNRLQDKALLREAVDVATFAYFLGGEAIAVGGKGPVGIWSVEPGLTEDAGFDFGELDVDCLGDTSWVSVTEPAVWVRSPTRG